VIRYSAPANFNKTSGWLGGTNGDTYKAHCNFAFAGANLGSVESPEVTL
jgi:hypothetical protein